MAPRIVTFSSDFGWAYAAQAKGVLARWVPPGRIVDLAHDLPRHAIAEAAFLLRAMASTFPAGTVHLAIVDPGVGGGRAPVAVACEDGSLLVGPDNGLLAPLAEALGIRSVVRLDPERVSPGTARSVTFDGRDLFAPAAGRLARGARIASLGWSAELSVRHHRESDVRDRRRRGHVVHVDVFGNLITDLAPSEASGPIAQVRVRIGARWHELAAHRTYSDAPSRAAVLMTSSFGTLEIAVRESSAARRFRARVGDAVELAPALRRPRRSPSLR